MQKRRRPKILAVLLGAMLLVLTALPAFAADYDEAKMKQTAVILLENSMAMDDETLETFKSLREEELNYVLLQNGIPCNGDQFLSIVKSWKDAEEECGPFVPTISMQELLDTFEVKEQSGDLILTGEMQFADRTAEVSFTFEEDGTCESLTVGGRYALNEILKKAGLNTVIGMGVVFVVLILISIIISLFKFINMFQNRAEERKNALAAAAVTPAAPAAGNEQAAVSAAPAGAQEAFSIPDNSVVNVRVYDKSERPDYVVNVREL